MDEPGDRALDELYRQHADAQAENERLRHRITVAIGYLTDPTMDRGDRIRLAILALENKPALDEDHEPRPNPFAGTSFETASLQRREPTSDEENARLRAEIDALRRVDHRPDNSPPIPFDDEPASDEDRDA